MIRYPVLCVFAWSIVLAAAQEQTLRLTPDQIETLFLKENLQLVAEKMNIDIADAAIAQARLWDNPELSIGQLNVWTPGKEKQFGVELSQLIQTANKRHKRIDREKISREMAVREFENVLRGLKLELRKAIHELACYQSFRKVLNSQSESLAQLIAAYKKQEEQQNVSRTEVLRLQSSLLSLQNEIHELKMEYGTRQRILKSLLHLDSSTVIEIDGSREETPRPLDFSLEELLAKAMANRPDARQLETQIKFFEKSLAYEKALRIPDITLSANYDRYGGPWEDFTGVKISFDLPVFNHNKGNIRAAKTGREQSRILLEQQQNIIRQEVTEAFDNYTQAFLFYREINANSLPDDLDDMLKLYAENLLKKNISMLEYIDFTETYKTNKQLVLTAEKRLHTLYEELQYATGTTIE